MPGNHWLSHPWLDRLRWAIKAWALLGGGVLVALVLMTVASVFSGLLIGQPIAGDFELVEMGVAIAVFAFLPFCQLERANVTADIFTQNASPRARSWMALMGSVAAILFSCLLLWRMSAGMVDYLTYDEFTAILGIPIWYAFLPILLSLVLLCSAALLTLGEDIKLARQS